MIPPLIQRDFDRLQRAYPTAKLRAPSDASVQGVVVEIPGVILPPGWSKPSTFIRFLVPLAYPAAPPDCFWADLDLTLQDGRLPNAARPQAIPGQQEPLLWFSWHVQQWDANTHTLVSFMQVVFARLRIAT
jgi:hypothetical protein